jgi:hypothetical protein
MARVNIHHYGFGAYVPMYLALSVIVIVLGGNGVALLIFASEYPGDGYGGLLLVIGALVVACWFWIFHLQHLPISYDEEGISTISVGKRRRSIAWHDVTRIEMIRREDLITGACRHTFFVINAAESVRFDDYRHTLFVINAGAGIRFDDRIEGLRDLLDAMNVFATRYAIPIISIDHGSDTHERQLLTVKDSKERRQLERDGVRLPLLRL